MKYRYEVLERDIDTKRFVRSVNAYCSKKRAEEAADRYNAENGLFRVKNTYYEVFER